MTLMTAIFSTCQSSGSQCEHKSAAVAFDLMLLDGWIHRAEQVIKKKPVTEALRLFREDRGKDLTSN